MRFIDLFAGAGGFSEGFKRAGFQPVAHIEIDPAACLTLKTRAAFYYLKEHNGSEIYRSYLEGEITRKQLYSFIPPSVLESVIRMPIGSNGNRDIFLAIDTLSGKEDVDVIIGGPPCQAYSLVGRARNRGKMRGDPRSYLYLQYGSFLKRYTPKAFIFENVVGLLSAEQGKYYINLKKYFRRLGYVVHPIVLNASHFGVLQNRTRLIIIGWQKTMDVVLDEMDESMAGMYTVRSIFQDLPKIQAGEGKNKNSHYTEGASPYLLAAKIRTGKEILTQHVARPHTEQDKEIYRIAVEKWNSEKSRLDYNELPERLKTHKNRHSFKDRFKVVAADLPCAQTIMAHIAKDGHYYIHPDILQNRSISVREAARLQSFPDDYYFEGAGGLGQIRTPAFKQIGNAVPPLMIEIIAKKLLSRIK